MATISAEFLGMMGLHHNVMQPTHHQGAVGQGQRGYSGLIVRSTTPSCSETSETSSSDSPDGTASSGSSGSSGSDRQSPALRPESELRSDPVHNPSPTKSEDRGLQIDEADSDESESSDTSFNEDSHSGPSGEKSANQNNESKDNNSAIDMTDTTSNHSVDQNPVVIKPEPVYDQSIYSTPMSSRHSSNYSPSPIDSVRSQVTPNWSQSGNCESPALRKMVVDSTPTGQRSQAMKRNYPETATVHGSFMAHPAAKQGMLSPAMMMMAAQFAGSEAMAGMSGMIPHPWMMANLSMAMGNQDNKDQQVPMEGAPLDLSTMETPSKKLRRTPSPGRFDKDEPMNLSIASSRNQEPQKRSSLPGGATQQQHQRHMEDLVKRQLTQKEALKLQEVLYYEHMLLVTQLTCRSEVEGHHGSFQRLHHIYMMEVDRIEKERYKALVGNLSDQQRQTTLTTFDQERLTLVLRIKQELSMLLGPSQSNMLRPTVPAPVPISSVPAMQSIPSMPTMSSMPSMQSMQTMSGMPSMSSMPGMSGMPQPMMYPMGVMYPWKQNSSPPEDDNKDKIKKFLSPGAVKVLMEWYNQNEEHPYPEEDTVHQLAMKAQVSPAQVKKWMANKRVRSSNTLSHNGSIHPKKLQKVLQIQEMARWMTSPEQQHPQHHQQPQIDQARHANQSAAKKSKRALNPQAVEAMNRWYFSHLHYPYPTDEEKIQLAHEGNITVAQVTCWFANKRNRSNNAKKFSPILMTPEEKANLYQGLKKHNQKVVDINTSPNGYHMSHQPPHSTEGYLKNIINDPAFAAANESHQNIRRQQQENMTSPTGLTAYPELVGRYDKTPEAGYNVSKEDMQHRLMQSASSVSSSTDHSPEGSGSSGDEGRLLIDENRPQMQSLDLSPQSPVSH